MGVVLVTIPILICMGAKGKSKYNSLFKLGDVIGSWTVVGEVVIDRYAKIPCECGCGKRVLVDAYTLSTGKSRSCITCFNANCSAENNNAWRGYKEVPASWMTRFRNYAKKKHNEFSITMEDVWEIYMKQDRRCALTNLEINFKRKGTGRHASYTASIDRVDSHKGYTKDNIQLVHKDINLMKNAFSQDHFIEMCRAVANKNKGYGSLDDSSKKWSIYANKI